MSKDIEQKLDRIIELLEALSIKEFINVPFVQRQDQCTCGTSARCPVHPSFKVTCTTTGTEWTNADAVRNGRLVK